MASAFQIKQGDTSPSLLYNLSPAPSTLVGATVVFNMKQGSTVVINRASAVIVSASQLRYDWDAGDTDTVGSFLGEFEITYADGSVGTWPNRGFIPINVYEDIA